MVKYFIKRILLMIPTLLGILIVVFFLVYNLPGSSENEFSSAGDGDALDRFYESVGASDNAMTKLVRYFYDVVVYGDFGPPAGGTRSVGASLVMRAPRTLILTGIGLLISLAFGIPAGIMAATHQNRWQDHSVSFVSLAFSSVPSYCLALVLVLIFILWLGLLPSVAYSSWKSYILPAIVLGAGASAMIARMTRAAAIEVLGKPYITALRAKGVHERRVIYVHVLKNSLIPIVSSMNNIIIQMLCSTLIVENFFNITGLGTFLVSAITTRNQHVVLGGVMLLAVVIMLVSIVTDMLCILVNPRMKAQYSKKRTAAEE